MADMDDTPFETDEVISAEKVEDVLVSSTSALSAFVFERFNRSEDARRGDEERWLRAYRNYRGIYGPDVQFTDTEKSRVFIKVTKTKTLASYGQITDVLFGNNKFPLSVNPSVLPDGVSEAVHINIDPGATQAGDALNSIYSDTPSEPFILGGKDKLKPGDTIRSLTARLGPLTDKLSGVSDRIVEGEGTGPTTVTFHPAMVAAKKMEKKIHDQLQESGANTHLRSMAFEMALLGTGVMKGPFAVDKEYPNWNEDGEYTPLIKTVPETSHVSIWDFYPDPEARSMEEAEYIVQRHKMSRTQLRALRRRPYFIKDAIQDCIDKGPDYQPKHWEQSMEDDSNTTPHSEPSR